MRRVALAFLFAMPALLGVTLRGGNMSGVSKPPDPVPPFPSAYGEAAYQTRGAFSGSQTPEILVVTTLDDERDGCVNVGASNETCPDKCNTLAGSSNGTCSLREAIMYPAPRIVACNVAGTIQLQDRLRMGASVSFLTFDASTCPGPLMVGNYALEIAGATNVVIRNIIWLPIGQFAVSERGKYVNCNDVRQYCADSGTSPTSWRTTAGGDVRSDDGSNQWASAGDCDGVSGHTFEMYADRSTWDPTPGYCTPCDSFDPSTGATTGCSDTELIGGSSLDAVSIFGASRNIIMDRATLGWHGDEGFSITTCENEMGTECVANVTLQRSIIGPGVAGSDTYPAHREVDHYLGSLVNAKPDGEARNATGLAYVHVAWMLVAGRAPWWNGGHGTQYQNYFYQTRLGRQGVNARCATEYCRLDFVKNLFRVGSSDMLEERRHFGYCSGGTDDGRWCNSQSTCAGGGTCSLDRWCWLDLNALTKDAKPGNVYLSGNVATDAGGTPYSASATPELDAQWDLTCPPSNTTTRPNRLTAGTNHYFGRRAFAAQSAHGRWPGSVDPMTLRAVAAVEWGSAHQTPIDREWWSIDAADGDYDDQAFLPASPRVYPTYSAAVPWADNDSDGISDSWEAAHCAGNCDPFAVSDVDGYLWIQRWLHRDDFGEQIPQITPD